MCLEQLICKSMTKGNEKKTKNYKIAFKTTSIYVNYNFQLDGFLVVTKWE